MATSKIESASLASDAVDNTNIDSTLITAQTEKTSLVDADKFLISDSAASGALKYVQKSNLPSGGLQHVSTTVTSSGVSSFYINNCFSSSYQNYMVIFQNIRTNSDCNVRIRFASSGSSDSSNSYAWVGMGIRRGGTNADYYSNGTDSSLIIFKSLDGTDGGSQAFGVFYISSPFVSTLAQKRLTGTAQIPFNSVSDTTTYNVGGDWRGSATSFDGLQILTDSGTFRSGSTSDGEGLIKIYGIVDS